jgi:hypothetical protein
MSTTLSRDHHLHWVCFRIGHELACGFGYIPPYHLASLSLMVKREEGVDVLPISFIQSSTSQFSLLTFALNFGQILTDTIHFTKNLI